MENSNKFKLSFAAIDPYLEQNIVKPTETIIQGKNFVVWGDANIFPNYIYDLYLNVSTLHSIIDGTVDFILGEGTEIDDLVLNNNSSLHNGNLDDLVRGIAFDLVTYGGFAINVLRNKFGKVCSLNYVPLIRLRTSKDKDKFYYSEDWSKSYGRIKYIEYNKFDKNSKDDSSIYYYCKNRLGVYPISNWVAATTACEIERNINEYHLNSLANGFSASYIINFNNGIPNDEQKLEIEEYVNEKFAGSKNAGRILLNFSESKDRSSEVAKLDTDDYGEKYKSLVERTRQEIFTSFRATPNLFGLPTATTGFNEQEYNESFKLYNRTVVKPLQKIIVKSINYITDSNLKIEPFSLE